MKLIKPAENPAVPTPDHTKVSSQEIAGELDDIGGSGVLSEHKGFLAQGIEQWHAARHRLRRARSDGDELCRRSSFRSAEYGSGNVELSEAGVRLIEAARERHADGAHAHMDAVGLERGNGISRPEDDFLYSLIVGEHGDEHLAPGSVCGSAGNAGAVGFQFLSPRAAAVINRNLVAGFQKIPSHWQTHSA